MPEPRTLDLQNLPDADVVLWAQRGREDAFRELVRRYERPIFSLIYRMVRDRETSEDLAQDTFIKVLNHIDRYSPEFRLSSWLFKIANNVAIDYLRKRRVNFLFIPRQLPPQDSAFDRIDFGTLPAVVIGYDAAVMDSLAKHPEVRFENFPRFLDVYIGALGELDPARLRRDYPLFKAYYFDHTYDPERERKILERIR